jgi:hypothetical protein
MTCNYSHIPMLACQKVKSKYDMTCNHPHIQIISHQKTKTKYALQSFAHQKIKSKSKHDLQLFVYANNCTPEIKIKYDMTSHIQTLGHQKIKSKMMTCNHSHIQTVAHQNFFKIL